MSHELIRVCKEHRDSFSEGCTVCQLLFDRENLVRSFWYVRECLERSQDEKEMKEAVDHIIGVAGDMVNQYGDPKGAHQRWPRPGSTMR
jgi:hypothetical protein